MLLEYVPGGELFTHLRAVEKFSSDAAKFYSAEIALAFDYLHTFDVIYRDLKVRAVRNDKCGIRPGMQPWCSYVEHLPPSPHPRHPHVAYPAQPSPRNAARELAHQQARSY